MRLLFPLISLLLCFLSPSAAAQIVSANPHWEITNWQRGSATLDMDFVNDRYFLNGTSYTGVQNFITGAGATFTRAGTTNVTDTNPPFYLNTSIDSFVSRASVTNNVTAYAAPFYIGTTGNGPSQSFVSRADSSKIATYFDNTGTLQTVTSNGAARSNAYYYSGGSWVSGGTLIEPAATNSIRNNTMQGAVAADGVERSNNGTFSTTSPNVCSGSDTSSGNSLSCSTGTAVTAQTISSITYSSTTATLTTGSAHGLAVGNIVTVSGASPSNYNGAYMVVSVPSSTTFTYTMITAPTSNATVTSASYTATTGGWAGTVNGGSGSVTGASGSMTLTGDGTNAASAYQAITTISGYHYTITITTGSGNAVTVRAGTSVGGATLLGATSVAASTTIYLQFIASGTTSYIQINNASTTAATVTSLSVQSAGHWPTDWNEQHATGLNVSVVGTGTDSGINYIDFSISGTPSSGALLEVIFLDYHYIGATVGQTWTASAFAKLTSGSLTNVANINFNYNQVNSAQSAGAQANTFYITPTSNALATQQFVNTATTSYGAIATVSPEFIFGIAAGNTVNFTIRIGMPQMEQNPYATSVIATSSAAVTRAADVYQQQPASYVDGTGTLYFAAANVARDNHNTASPYADLGTLIEPAATNAIRNNMMVGAVAADGVERTNNGTFSTTSPNVCSGTVNSGGGSLTCNNGSGTGWVGTINSGTGSVTAASGSMTLTGDGTNAASVYQAIPVVSGYTYTIVVTTGAGNAVTVQAGTSVGGTNSLAATTVSASSSATYQFIAYSSGSIYVQINNTSATAAIVNSLSVQSAGALPTDWLSNSITGATTLAYKIAATGTENGINYTDVQFYGTNTNADYCRVYVEKPNGVGASPGQNWTLSTYLKLSAGSFTNVTNPSLQQFEEGSAITAIQYDSASITAPTNNNLGTQRYVFSNTITNSSAQYVYPLIQFKCGTGAINFTLRIGMPQMEQSSYATSAIPTFGSAVTRTADVYSMPNGGTYFNSSGVLTQAAVNAPRLDHAPTSPYSAQGILIEESRANLLTYSANFSGYGNSGAGTTTTANATTSPDGTTDATLLSTSTSSANQYIYQSFSGAASTTYTFSLFAKNVSGSTYHQVAISLGNTGFGAGGSQDYVMVGELNNCTVANGSIGGDTSVAYTAQVLSNGWCRFSVTGTSLASPGPNYVASIYVYNSNLVYTGNGNGIYIWGAQLEAGAFPTSYIPTSGSTVTRAADVFTLPTTATGANGAWYNSAAAQGTLAGVGIIPYLPSSSLSKFPTLVSLNDGTLTNAMDLYINEGTATFPFAAELYNGGTKTYSIAASTYTAGANAKMAMAFQSSNIRAAYNSNLFYLDTSDSVPATFSQLNIGGSPYVAASLNGWVNRIWYMPTRQPDATLAGYTQ